MTVMLLLSACATPGGPHATTATSTKATDQSMSLAQKVEQQLQSSAAQPVSESVNSSTKRRPTKPIIIRGDGKFINTKAASQAQVQEASKGDVTLNFELADIRDVVKVIFDTLGENYILDPAVQGQVTVQTSRPLPKNMLLPTLETLLRQVGATLIHGKDGYRIVPRSQAAAGNGAPASGNVQRGPGYGVRIFPLHYISAKEMAQILKPFAPQGGILLVDPVRNLLILGGSQQELDYLQETINTFDVNWLKGMSIGMYPLQNVDAGDMADQLDKLFGPKSKLPFAGMFRFVPISRLNALLVITPQADYLKEVTVWIQRLDNNGGERLYVYQVQNGDADYLAQVLGQVFGTKSSSVTAPSNAGRVAPGMQPSQISSGSSGFSSGTSSSLGSTSINLAALQASTKQSKAENQGGPVVLGSDNNGSSGSSGSSVVNAAGGKSGRSSGSSVLGENVKIVADTTNNSLLIWASNQQYNKILDALRQIDVPKRQVLIEATIAEVTLSGDLQYGLEWWFKNNNVGGSYQGTGALGLNNQTQLSGALQNISGNAFNYAISDSAGIVRALLNVLATESKVRVLSSPQLMVLDNQEARIQVGTQQPILSSTTVTTGGNTTQSVEYKDTGVILDVTPKVNSSGQVTLNISQEVTDVGSEDPATHQTTFLARKISSKVSVQSGQTIVLGGLIKENQSSSSGGLPGLYQLPVIGALFGNKTHSYDRTELVVLLTPLVVQNNEEATQVANEIKRRMQDIIPLRDPWKAPLRKPAFMGPK